jgi:hypothetical protein
MAMLKDEPVILSVASARDVRRLDRGFLATCALLLTATACSIVVVAAPRQVQPSQLPALRLPRVAVAEALAADQQRARHVPQSPALERWLELFREEGLAEREKSVNLGIVAEQRAELRQLVQSEFPKLGSDGVRALMSAVTGQALAALSARKPPPEAYGLLGAFPVLLARYGYIEPNGALRAPELAVRALYKVRFNLICERPLDTDLSKLERLAYEGWNALHAGGLAPERRAQAARAFASLAGTDAREALAIWLFQGGMRTEAAELLRSEYERTGALRMRNMQLFASRHGS